MTIRALPRTAVLFVFAVLVLSVAALRADPVVVTSGLFSAHSGGPATNFHFIGEDFDLRASLDEPGQTLTLGPLQTCHTCPPGASIDLSSRATGTLVGQWVNPDFPNRFQGVEHPTVFFSGDLRFDAATVQAPPITRPSEVVDLTAPFLFSGHLTAFGTPDRTGPALFSVMLTGHGDIDLLIGASDTLPLWLPEDLDYRFTSASVSPTPEPGTLMLVAGGFLSANVIRRRSIKHRRKAD